MKSRVLNTVILLLLLVFLFPVSGHEENNVAWSADGYFWSWDTAFGVGDSNTWHMEVWDDGEVYLEGEIDITVKQSLQELNLLDFYNLENETISFESYTNNFFDIKFGDRIAYYSQVYNAKYFYAPIFFQHENGSQYNILDSSMTQDDLYIGLINETIDLTCLQGCHSEDDNPFYEYYTNLYICISLPVSSRFAI